jgi:hypothetical protein
MYNNPYFNQQQRFQGMNMMQQPMPTQQYIPPMPTIQQNNLQGKIVDSVDVVKAMDIPLDGSVSYFPLTDGSAIISKQLQSDGTSRTIIYKPSENEKEKSVKYLTIDELETALNDLEDMQNIKDDIKEIKKQLKGFKKGKEE